MKKLILMFLCLVTVGCATVGRKIDQNAINSIEKGKTTREEVIRSLGSPDQISRDINGNITMTYTYVRSSAKPESFIPIVGAFAGGVNMQNQTVMVTIDQNGKVKDVFDSHGATEAGYGLSSGSKADIQDVEEDKRPK